MKPCICPSRAGFTLAEVVVVVVLVAILAVMAIPSMESNDDTAVTASSVAAFLRFAQLKAMSDVDRWGVQVGSTSLVLLDNGTTASKWMPGQESATYNLPEGVTISAGTGTIEFDFRGRPYVNSSYLSSGSHTITVAGDPNINVTISSVTGFIP